MRTISTMIPLQILRSTFILIWQSITIIKITTYRPAGAIGYYGKPSKLPRTFHKKWISISPKTLIIYSPTMLPSLSCILGLLKLRKSSKLSMIPKNFKKAKLFTISLLIFYQDKLCLQH